MKNQIIIVFDFAGTLVKMRPPILLIKRNLLQKLYEKVKLGIITGAKRAETNNILSKLKIRKYFDFVITKDDSPYRKPDKRFLEKIKRKITSKKIIYIGDSKKDFILAKNAKVQFCYVGKRKLGIYQNEDINQIISLIVKYFLK